MSSSKFSTPPFTLPHQLDCSLDGQSKGSTPQPSCLPCLPGYPSVLLQNQSSLSRFLEYDLCSEDLDRVGEKLWWMSKQDSRNVSPLHRQLVKQRALIVTEDPKLHLVWIHNRIFIKPLPKYLLSYTFWEQYLGGRDDNDDGTARIVRAALGYLRTYTYLVRYESDFRIALDPGLQLLPPDVTWEQFCAFRSDLARIADDDVSQRYRYGEIRLTRLNFYAPILLGKTRFQRVDYQYGTYFARFYGPILFVVAVASVLLGGFQVAVAVEQEYDEKRRHALSTVALWVSIIIIVCSTGLVFCLGGLLVYKVAREWKFAIRDRLRLQEEGRLKNRE